MEHVGGLGLAHLEDEPVGKQGGGARPEVEVRSVVAEPGGGGERVEQLHGGAELEHAVALVVGVARGVERAVARGHPDIALGVDGRCRPTHPHRPLAVAGLVGHREHRRVGSVLGSRDHQAVIGIAVTGVAPEAHDHPPCGQPERYPLQLKRRAGAGRVDHLVQLDQAGEGVQSDQMVGGTGRSIGGDRLGGHYEDLVAGRVDDRRTGDSHGGMDVAAQPGDGGRIERGTEVAGPQDLAGVCRQGVDGVVLGGGEHPASEDQGLAVELPVEGRRGPGRGGRRERVPRRVDPGPQPVVAERRPVGGGRQCRPGPGRGGRRRHRQPTSGHTRPEEGHQEHQTGNQRGSEAGGAAGGRRHVPTITRRRRSSASSGVARGTPPPAPRAASPVHSRRSPEPGSGRIPARRMVRCAR